jgi:hypothetical protein
VRREGEGGEDRERERESEKRVGGVSTSMVFGFFKQDGPSSGQLGQLILGCYKSDQ